MNKTKGRQVSIRIKHPETWDKFISYVEDKHGKIFGNTGTELENMINFYLDHPNIDEITQTENHLKTQLHNIQTQLKEKTNIIKPLQNELQEANKKIDILKKLTQQTETLQKTHQDQIQEINILKTEKALLQNIQEKYNTKTEQHTQLLNQHDKLRNKYDHLQERFNKSQKELNSLERENSDLRVVVAKIEKLSFWERLINRLPEEVKQLTSSENK